MTGCCCKKRGRTPQKDQAMTHEERMKYARNLKQPE